MEGEKKVKATRKTYADGSSTALCKGKDGECGKVAIKNGLCTGCNGGTSRDAFKGHKKGDIFWAGEYRYRKGAKKSRRLCNGSNNTCNHAAVKGDLCEGHVSGRLRSEREGHKDGDIIDMPDGTKRMWRAGQIRKICTAEGCDQYSQKDGMCKTHSPYWHCKFTGHECKKIRTNGKYCARHKGNVVNPRIKSAGEELVANYLDAKGVKYTRDEHIRHDGEFFYPDFILHEHNAVIEVDGRQHFTAVGYFKGEEGLARRKYKDAKKDQWALANGYHLLRISFADLDMYESYIDAFFQYLEEAKEEESEVSVVGTSYYDDLDRGYTII